MIRSFAIATAVFTLLVLTACANPGRGQADIAIYDFGPASSPASGSASAHAGVALEVRLPVWLDSSAMTYRLAYAEPQRLHQYAKARWAGQPAPLLQSRLRQLLAIAPGGAPCTLRVELDGFGQVFDTPATSRAEMHGEALLLGRGRAVQARLPLHLDATAPSPDAGGGVQAMVAVSDRAATELARWLQTQDLSGCRMRRD